MVDAFSFAAGLEDCEVETKVSKSYRGYRFKPDDPVVRLAHDGARASGYSRPTALSGGAADANVFNERGLACLNLANGMQDIHTPDERIAVADLEGMVEVTLALVDVARELTLRRGRVTAIVERRRGACRGSRWTASRASRIRG